jgi:uncharacterized repeat protein (TIGR01451 family)
MVKLACALVGMALAAVTLPACGSSATTISTTLAAARQSGTLEPGDSANFTATITNHGPAVAQNVTLQVDLPQGFRYQATTKISGDGSRTQPSDPAVNSPSPEWGLWVLGAPVGTGSDAILSSVTVSFSVLVGGSPGQYSVTARSAADNATSDTAPPTVRVNVAAAADLSLRVTAQPTAAHHNSTITYSLIATNTGSGNATTFEALATLPAGFVYAKTDSISGNSARATVHDPEPNSQVPFWGDFTVPARSGAGPGTITIKFEVKVTQGTPVGTYPLTVQVTDAAGDKVTASNVVPVQIS